MDSNCGSESNQLYELYRGQRDDPVLRDQINEILDGTNINRGFDNEGVSNEERESIIHTTARTNGNGIVVDTVHVPRDDHEIPVGSDLPLPDPSSSAFHDNIPPVSLEQSEHEMIKWGIWPTDIKRDDLLLTTLLRSTSSTSRFYVPKFVAMPEAEFPNQLKQSPMSFFQTIEEPNDCLIFRCQGRFRKSLPRSPELTSSHDDTVESIVIRVSQILLNGTSL